MELDDCAFPLLAGIDITDDRTSPSTASTCVAGRARPRGPGMERSDLLEANGGIFAPQGQAIKRPRGERCEGAGRGHPADTKR